METNKFLDKFQLNTQDLQHISHIFELLFNHGEKEEIERCKNNILVNISMRLLESFQNPWRKLLALRLISAVDNAIVWNINSIELKPSSFIFRLCEIKECCESPHDFILFVNEKWKKERGMAELSLLCPDDNFGEIINFKFEII